MEAVGRPQLCAAVSHFINLSYSILSNKLKKLKHISLFRHAAVFGKREG